MAQACTALGGAAHALLGRLAIPRSRSPRLAHGTQFPTDQHRGRPLSAVVGAVPSRGGRRTGAESPRHDRWTRRRSHPSHASSLAGLVAAPQPCHHEGMARRTVDRDVGSGNTGAVALFSG